MFKSKCLLYLIVVKGENFVSTSLWKNNELSDRYKNTVFARMPNSICWCRFYRSGKTPRGAKSGLEGQKQEAHWQNLGLTWKERCCQSQIQERIAGSGFRNNSRINQLKNLKYLSHFFWIKSINSNNWLLEEKTSIVFMLKKMIFH